VEIKYSLSPKLTKGFWTAYEDLSCKRGFVVYPGADSYPLKQNVLTLSIHQIDRLFS